MRKELKRRINKVMNELQAMKELIDSDALQEQPEVDLEEEYKEYVEDDPVFSKLTNRNVGLAIARHFYELGLNTRKGQKPVEIHIDNPNIQKIDPNVKISISDSSADGEELLYVCNKSYKIGYRDGVNSVKPAEWSEEDKEMLEYIIGDVNDATQLYTTRAGKDMAEKEIAWLKSLRPSWKPSKDEERLINTSISFLKDFADKGYENAVECIDWLKSKLNGNTGK